MNKNIKVILFDLGRVLMHIDFDAFPNGLGLFTEEQRAPYAAPTKKLIPLYETGKMTTEEFLDALYVAFDCRFSKEQILEAFNGIICEDNLEIVPLVQKLQRQYTIAVLSNTCECHWDKALKISPLLRSIPNHFTSFHLGVMKPDRIIYEKVCASLSVQPNEVLFIDDLKVNVDGAITAGMQGIVFTNAKALEVQL